MRFNFLALLGVLLILRMALSTAAQEGTLNLTVLGTYSTGIYGAGAAEIAAYSPETQQVYVINGSLNTLDILNISDPANPTLTSSVDLSMYGAVNSVAIYDDIVAVAVDGVDRQQPGNALFFDLAGNLLSSVSVGAVP